MARTRLVNGKPVSFTIEEEAARDAEEAAVALRRSPTTVPSDIEILKSVLLDKTVFTQTDWDAKKAALTI